MKAISIRQPWAWAVINAGKSVENRDWARMPKYRGPLLIHASKTPDPDWDEACSEIERISGAKVPPKQLLCYGGIIGKVELVDTASEYDGEAFESEWWGGPCGLLFDNASPIPFFRLNGKLGLFEVSDDAISGNISLVSCVA